jgi:hypothetical protein
MVFWGIQTIDWRYLYLTQKDCPLRERMDGNGSRVIGRRLLDDLNSYLWERWPTLKCCEVAEICWGFFDDLKSFRDTATGFTGLSEFLMFRFLYHQLGGQFERRSVTKDLWEFRAKADDRIRLGQNLRVEGTMKTYRPDVVLFKDDELLAAIQVKVYAVYGKKTIEKELAKLKDLKERYRGLRALLVFFHGPPARGKGTEYLKKEAKRAGWWDFLALRENRERLAPRIESILNLKRAGIGLDL